MRLPFFGNTPSLPRTYQLVFLDDVPNGCPMERTLVVRDKDLLWRNMMDNITSITGASYTLDITDSWFPVLLDYPKTIKCGLDKLSRASDIKEHLQHMKDSCYSELENNDEVRGFYRPENYPS